MGKLTIKQRIKLLWWKYTNPGMWEMRILLYAVRYVWVWKVYSALRKMSTTKIKVKDGIVWKHHRYFFWRAPENIGTYKNNTMILK